MNNKRDIGKTGEDQAMQFLKNNNYEILDRNFRYRRAEIDIIARKIDLIIFIEVKKRANNKYGFPESFVSEEQTERIMEAAEEYVFQNNWNGNIRFDIISIEGSGDNISITHFKDAIH